MLLAWQVSRGVAWLERLALATERQAVALETLARISQDEWAIKHAPRPRGTGFVSGVMDVEAVNKRWREMNKSEFDVESDS